LTQFRSLVTNLCIAHLYQVELHPYLVQSKLARFCAAEGIAVTGFSPLGSSSYVEIGMAKKTDAVIDEKVVKDIAAKHSKTPAQVVLRWGIQRGTFVYPTSLVDALKSGMW